MITRIFAVMLALGAACGQAFATSAAPPQYPSPLTCTRNFYVSPSGSDTASCGGGPLGNAANCATPWGADAATSIGATGTTLTGGDCVNVLGTVPTQSTFGSTGWTNYDLGSSKIFSRSGTSNAPGGYINYVCSVNHGCKMTLSSNANGPAGSAVCQNGNYIAFDGFEVDGINLATYAGYNGNNTNTYRTPSQLFCNGGHHHFHLNGIYHSTGGPALGSIGSSDYEYIVATEVYDFAGTNPCHTTGVGWYQPTLFTPGSPTAWDNLPNHLQILMSVIHDGGETAAETGTCSPQGTAHTDGNCVSLDDWMHLQADPTGNSRYTASGLVAYTLMYNCGGHAMEVQSATNATFLNNTAWGGCLDQTEGGCGVGFAVGDNTSVTTTLFKNNIFVRTSTAGGDASGSYQTGGWAFRMDGGNSIAGGITNNLTYDIKKGGISVASFSGNDGANVTTVTNNNQFLATNPDLTNPTTDLHPLAGSPVLGQGVNVNVTPVVPFKTADGIIPNAQPDVGALSGGAVFSGPVSVNSGGPAVGSFVADAGFSGGFTISNNPGGAVDTSLVANPAPTQVYRSERYGTFSYNIGQLKPGKTYVINLHFTEDFDSAANVRLMDVSINGTSVLSSFDIFAATGAKNKAIVKTFNVPADTNGNIAISFAPHSGSTDTSAKVDGVEVLNATPVPTVPGNFNYNVGKSYDLDLPIPSANAPVAHLANTIRCAPVAMRNLATIDIIGVRVYHADAAGHVGVGIYANGTDNRPGALVASSASMAATPAGTAASAALSANVQAGPGSAITDKFWYCSNTDSSTASFASVSNTGGLPPTLIGASTMANILQQPGTGALLNHLSCAGAACNGGSSTYGTFPANLGGSTWSEQTTANMPMIGAHFLSVP